jgi:hypothetical protein
MNPFTQRGRITEPQYFIGRWRELSVVFDRLGAGKPVLVTGIAGIGKSSLLTHVAQSAAVNLEKPDLRAYYIDLGVLEDAADCYQLMLRALRGRGNDAAALEVALLQIDHPIMFCFDNADRAVAAGWGEDLLQRLARIMRHSVAARPAHRSVPENSGGMAGMEQVFYIVAVWHGMPETAPAAYTVVGMGAFGSSEVRLFTDAYLDETSVQFSAEELRQLSTLSMGHPAYLQRAAFHLFRAHQLPDYDWQAAYLKEASERPVPGAPLPPAVFEGGEVEHIQSFFGYQSSPGEGRRFEQLELSGAGELLLALLPLAAALIAWQFGANWLVTGGVLLVAVALLLALRRLRRQPQSD